MKTRIIALLIIMSVLFATIPTSAAEIERHEYTIFDGLNILQHIVGLEELTPEQFVLYDFFDNGNIDIFNFIEILLYLVGVIDYPGDPLYIKTGITSGHLKQMGWFDDALTPELIEDLNNTLERFDIITPGRVRHFISQCTHESLRGKYTKEIADGSDYESCSFAIVPNPCTIFTRCAGKKLGNTQPGDGMRFKGAGYLQMTGRYNYQQFADYIDDQRVMLGVDYVAENYPWMSAGFWWHNNGMNELVDGGTTVEEVTLKVNGGLAALYERQRYYNMAVGIFR
ncbi:MAG: hypothetical protein FWF94_00910 [Oscillospiraceae bacterium]|nr:hypothetical protein [Oscillospiraceae bacterium]